MRDPREARPFVRTEMRIRRIKIMAESDSSESGGAGSCESESGCSCPSGYLPLEGRIKKIGPVSGRMK